MVSTGQFTTAMKRERWNARIEGSQSPAVSEDFETVGAVALDSYGHLAAAGSTGGLTLKAEGRVVDTAILGAGLSVDRNIGVVWYVHEVSCEQSLWFG